HHQVDSCLRGRLDGGQGLWEAQVVELPDGGVARRAHFAVPDGIVAPHRVRRLPAGLEKHLVAPCPEVAAARSSAHRPLERVRVGVDEAGHAERLSHGTGFSPNYPWNTVATSSAPLPVLSRLPNALTIVRFALIPVFVVVYATADNGHSWAAGIIFGIAGITDQVA